MSAVELVEANKNCIDVVARVVPKATTRKRSISPIMGKANWSNLPFSRIEEVHLSGLEVMTGFGECMVPANHEFSP